MVTATRCPHCRTVFRVSEDTLRLAAGSVCCGHCNAVFDGARERLAEITDTDASVPRAADAARVSAAEPAHLAPLQPLTPLQALPPLQPLQPLPPTQPMPPIPPRQPAQTTLETRANQPAMSAEPGLPEAPFTARAEPSFAGRPASVAGNPTRVAAEVSRPMPRRRRSGLGAFLLVILLLVALVAQLTWWQREWVSVHLPSSQPVLANLCQRFGCTLAPARWIDGLQLETSSLRQVEGPHRLEMRMVLLNRAQVPLAYPALELTLLDKDNQVLIRRIEPPTAYLLSPAAAPAGIAAGARQAIALRLDTGDAVAANYRLVIFYP